MFSYLKNTTGAKLHGLDANGSFCLKFSQWHAIFEFFMSDRRFSCNFFLYCFHRSPPSIFTRTNGFASIENSLRFSALCDLPGTSSIFRFLKVFRWGKSGFLVLCISLEVFLALLCWWNLNKSALLHIRKNRFLNHKRGADLVRSRLVRG